MVILGVDTSGPECSAMVWHDGVVLASACAHLGRGHDARIAPMVQQVLGEAGLAVADVDRFGVCVGPGSFAGVRVGVAFVRGMAVVTGAPAVGLTRLDVLGAAALGRSGVHFGERSGEHSGLADGDVALVALDIKRGEVVWQIFAADGALGDVCWSSSEVVAGDMAAALQAGGVGGGVVLTGDGDVVSALAADGGFAGAEPVVLPHCPMATLCQLTSAADVALRPAKPFYQRPPDAKPAKAVVGPV